MKYITKAMPLALLIGLMNVHTVSAQNDALFVDPSGRVGIGTPKPGYTLTVSGGNLDNTFGVDNKAIFSAKNAAQQYERYLWPRWDDDKMYINYGKNGFVIRNNNNNQAMFMSPEGNIGIGTSNAPAAKLEVIGNIKLDAGKKLYWDWDGRAIDVVNADNNSRIMRFSNSMNANSGNTNGGFNFVDEHNTSVLRITDYKVGIGTPSPYAKLHVVGNIYTSIQQTNDDRAMHDAKYRGSTRIGMLSGEFTGMELETKQYDCGNGGVVKFYTWGCNAGYTREVVRINERGFMGIGTNNPGYPLEVNGFSNRDLGGEFFFMFKNECRRAGGGAHVNSISIKASNGIESGSGLYCTSDKRIKKNLAVSDNKTDLDKINRLVVTNYQYKDFVTHGTGANKGFIAQEVEKVFPQAVSKQTDFTPDIYALADNVSLKNGLLTVKLKSPHKLANGDVVRLITEQSEVKEVAVNVVDEKTFTVNNWDQPIAHLFVYGKRVDDFRVVEYQQIFTMGISAIQQLSKEVDELKTQNEKLQRQNEANEQQLAKDNTAMADILSRVEKIEAQTKIAGKL